MPTTTEQNTTRAIATLYNLNNKQNIFDSLARLKTRHYFRIADNK